MGNDPGEYTAKARSIIRNLTRSSELKTNLMENLISPEDLVMKDAKEFADEDLKQKRKDAEIFHIAAAQQGYGDENRKANGFF